MNRKPMVQALLVVALLGAAAVISWNKQGSRVMPRQLTLKNDASEAIAATFTPPGGTADRIDLSPGERGMLAFAPRGRLDFYVTSIQPPIGSWYIDAVYGDISISLDGRTAVIAANGLETRPAE